MEKECGKHEQVVFAYHVRFTYLMHLILFFSASELTWGRPLDIINMYLRENAAVMYRCILDAWELCAGIIMGAFCFRQRALPKLSLQLGKNPVTVSEIVHTCIR